MKKALAGALLLLVVVVSGMVTAHGWGESLATLNRLAAVGSIHEEAPVKTHLQIRITVPPTKVCGRS